jgi:hypothetical protein
MTGSSLRWQLGNRSSGGLTLASGRPMVIAAAVSVALPGGSAASSGINAGGAPQLEDPARPQDAAYTDKVMVFEAQSVFGRIRCSVAMAAMHTLANAQTLAADAEGAKQGNQVAGQIIGDIQMMATLAGVYFTVGAMIDGVNGIYGIVTNTEGLAKASSIIFLWWQIPNYVAGIASAVGAIALHVIDAARNAFSTGVEAVYGAQYYDFMDQAKGLPVWQGSMRVLQRADLMEGEQ